MKSSWNVDRQFYPHELEYTYISDSLPLCGLTLHSVVLSEVATLRMVLDLCGSQRLLKMLYLTIVLSINIFFYTRILLGKCNIII